jgi:hypothetical protein
MKGYIQDKKWQSWKCHKQTIIEVINSVKIVEEELMPSKKYSNKVQDELKSEESNYGFDEKPRRTKKKKTK